MPKCTINGKEVEVKEGTSIIEAMSQNEQKIAHYCWHPGLSVAGVCRLCVVEIEGNPRLQIACNTQVTEGMKINNTSNKVKDAVKWGLDFHLINHPLDCPVCDQAGECGLQDQYMEYGSYDSEMAERKVKKHKVVDLGPRVVLDSERCILCSRCVRFTDEVTKTKELGIFNRGDRSEIGTFENKPLNNKYSTNVVDICPVGALTSKDFRFRQRVWYLKDANTICAGCSTGCNVKVYYNREGLFRVKPRCNPEVNGYWMCDEGRDLYKYINLDTRLTKAKKFQNGVWTEMSSGAAAKDVWTSLKDKMAQASLVITGQPTLEEMEALVSKFTTAFKTKKVYYWQNNKESFDSFDGLLLRGDKNPNTAGLKKVFEKHQIQTQFSDLEKELSAGQVPVLVVAGPENQAVYPDFTEKVKLFSQAKNLVFFSSNKNDSFEKVANQAWFIPMKTHIEKSGTFINAKGLSQTFKRVTTVVSEALTLVDASQLLTGGDVVIEHLDAFFDVNKRTDAVTYESRKKNEYVFRRGSL